MKHALLSLATVAGMVLSVDAVAADFKACFVYVGSKTDGGWTQAHDIGRMEIERHFGGKVETAFLENVGEGPDAERAIERFARSGCGIVFTTSFGFMDSTLKVAKRFPGVVFEHATGYKTAENVTNYGSRFYEGRYILGKIAGAMSKTGTGGYIASFPIPEVVRGINIFTKGAREMDPDFKTKVVWVNTWFDAGKEADAAKALFDQGVDVITQHTDSTAPMQVAAERGGMAFGQASDMIAAGPDTQLTAIIDSWGPYYIKRVQSAMDGTWQSQSSWDGLVDGILTMADYTNMPAEVAAMAEETEAAIIAGDLHPFTGPINNQDGTLWLADGEVAEDGPLLGMSFYIEGVEGSLPQ